MTKKSEARKARDANNQAHAAGSTCWDDLTAVYRACAHSIDNAAARLNGLYSTPGVKPYLENNAEIAINIRGVVDDRNRLHARLNAIYAKHSAQTGGITQDNPDGLVESMRLMGEYEEWNSQMEMAFLPSIEYLVSEFTNGYQRFLTHQAILQAQAKEAGQTNEEQLAKA